MSSIASFWLVLMVHIFVLAGVYLAIRFWDLGPGAGVLCTSLQMCTGMCTTRTPIKRAYENWYTKYTKYTDSFYAARAGARRAGAYKRVCTSRPP